MKIGKRLPAILRAAAKDYDFILTILTIGLVAVIGILFVGGTIYTFFAAEIDPRWTQTAMYPQYVESMNSYLFPLLVALVLVLGLCVPRRLFTRKALLAVSVGMFVVTLALTLTVDLRAAWVFLLGAAAGLQLAVVAMTATRSRRLNYLQEGFLVRMGSALLHLGFIVLIAAFVIGVALSTQLIIFWVATALIMVGMVMSMYSSELSSLRRASRREVAQLEEEA